MTNVVGPWTEPEIPTFDAEGLMVPPWVKYPNLPRGSMGWRMGVGESYLDDFDKWWSRQRRDVRLRVKSVYPEPSDWPEYYKQRA